MSRGLRGGPPGTRFAPFGRKRGNGEHMRHRRANKMPVRRAGGHLLLAATLIGLTGCEITVPDFRQDASEIRGRVGGSIQCGFAGTFAAVGNAVTLNTEVWSQRGVVQGFGE